MNISPKHFKNVLLTDKRGITKLVMSVFALHVRLHGAIGPIYFLHWITFLLFNCYFRIGKLMLFGAIFRCLDPALTIAAMLSFKSPFVSWFICLVQTLD